MTNPSDTKPQIKRFFVTADPDAIFKAYQEDGVVIIKGFLNLEQLANFNREVDPHLERQRHGNRPSKAKLMEGSLASILPPQQKRVHNLVGFSKVFRHDILNHGLMHVLCRRAFSVTGDYWLASGAVIDNGPGTPEQIWHRDQPSYPVIQMGPGSAEGLVNFFTALTDFTARAGATQFLWHSHKVDGIPDGDPNHPIVLAEVKAGDSILLSGKMVHRGGDNSTLNFFRRSFPLLFPHRCSRHLNPPFISQGPWSRA
jgi:verruculogen synthase